MKKLLATVFILGMLIITDGHAGYVYIYDASGFFQKYDRYFLPPTRCKIGDKDAIPIRVGEFSKTYMDKKLRYYTVVCKIARALDIEKKIGATNGDTYLELKTSRFKANTLKPVNALPENFYQDYKLAE